MHGLIFVVQENAICPQRDKGGFGAELQHGVPSPARIVKGVNGNAGDCLNLGFIRRYIITQCINRRINLCRRCRIEYGYNIMLSGKFQPTPACSNRSFQLRNKDFCLPDRCFRS